MRIRERGVERVKERDGEVLREAEREEEERKGDGEKGRECVI
jgi:hypothetical protein